MTASDRLPPGHWGLPILGQTLNFLFNPNFVRGQADRHGEIFKASLLGQKAVFMAGADAAEFLLASGMENFCWGDGWPLTFRELLGERALFLQDGEEHRRNRKLLMPAFHGPALQQYVSTMNTIADRYLEQWQHTSQTSGELIWFFAFKQFTFDIASQLLIGADSGDDVVRLSALFDQLAQGFFDLFPKEWQWTRFARGIRARDAILEHINQVIQVRKAQLQKDALSLLVQAVDEDGNRLSDAELTAQAMLMLFAGHETTTSMLTFAVLEFAQHPEILAQARAEQEQFRDPVSGLFPAIVSLEQVGQMPYLDRVLLEVERRHPPVGGGFRRVIKPFTFKGYTVPQGWLALYSIIAIHQDPQLFPEPHRFNPDRFLEKPKPYSLLGFGGGPRICLGLAFAKLELKIMLAKLLRAYDWALLPGQNLKSQIRPTRRPQSGLRVQLQSR